MTPQYPPSLVERLEALRNGVDAFNPDARLAARSTFEAAEQVWKMAPEIIAALNASGLVEVREALRKCNDCLSELLAVVRGECPSLLDEDCGGSAQLDMEIEEALLLADIALGKCPACRSPKEWVPGHCKDPRQHIPQPTWTAKARAEYDLALQSMEKNK